MACDRSDAHSAGSTLTMDRALRNVLVHAAWEGYQQDSNDPGARFAGRLFTLGGSLLF